MISSSTIFSRGRKLDDLLSPILVKELRQGMRGRAFVISFLLIQVFLIVLVLGNVAAEGDRSALNYQNNFFWVIIGFALLLLMPFRGLAAISQEVRDHTIETIMLTRLTAWRVVFGKWSALFAQSLLFVAAVLPYVVLRYFVGGDDVISDFEMLLFMLWLSGLMIAASIAISALGNAIVRIIVVVAVGPTLISLANGNLFTTGLGHDNPWELVAWLLVFGFFIPAMLFEFTASSIAPTSENHAISRRLLALGFFSVSVVLDAATGDSFEAGVVISLIVLVGICYSELSEKPMLLLRLVEPIRRFGWMGRIIGIFFLPGWPSALLFSLATIPAAIGIHATLAPTSYASLDAFSVPLFIFAIFGSVLVPILICHLFWRKMKQVFLVVVLYNIILLGVASLLEGFAGLTHSSINKAVALLPGLPVLLTSMGGDSHKSFLPWCLVGNAITLIILTVILFVASRRYFRELFALMQPGKDRQTLPGAAEPGAVTP